MKTKSHPAFCATYNSSTKSCSVVNFVNGMGLSCCLVRRSPQLVAFCCMSISRINTAKPSAAAAVARLLVTMVLPTPPLLIVIAIVYMCILSDLQGRTVAQVHNSSNRKTAAPLRPGKSCRSLVSSYCPCALGRTGGRRETKCLGLGCDLGEGF